MAGYHTQTNEKKRGFFSPKGVHFTNKRREWLSAALVAWARARDVNVVLCVGWNSETEQAKKDELEAQKNLVIALVQMAQNRRQ